MAENKQQSGRARSLEDEYFHKRDQELFEKIRKASEAEQARQAMGSKTGVQNPEVIQALIDLGYTPENVSLLPFVPVVQMAWADGSITPAERDLIVKFARSRGIEAGSSADERLMASLAARPSDAFFEKANQLIQAVLASDSSPNQITADELVKHAEAIAAASGGILGLGRISAQERAMLTSIVDSIKGRKA